MKIGYARVSTEDQNIDRQIDKLKENGCEKIFIEKISGTKRERPELNKLLDQIRKDDTVIVCELTRISRSTKHLFEIVQCIEDVGANIKSLKESWLDTTTAHGKLLFTMFAGISQFERDLISERTKEGLSSARARGRVGGRPQKDDKAVEKAVKLYESKQYSIKEIVEMTGVSKATLYRKLK